MSRRDSSPVDWSDLRSAFISYAEQEQALLTRSNPATPKRWMWESWREVISIASRFTQVEGVIGSYLGAYSTCRDEAIRGLTEELPIWAQSFFLKTQVYAQAIRFCTVSASKRPDRNDAPWKEIRDEWETYPRKRLNREQLITLYSAILDREDLDIEGIPFLRSVLQAVKESTPAEQITEDRDVNQQHMDPAYFTRIRWIWDEALFMLREKNKK